MWRANGFGDSTCVEGGGALAADDPDDLSIDIESFYKILDENSNPSGLGSSPEDLPFKTLFEDVSTPVAVAVHEKESQANNGTQGSGWPALMRDGLQPTSPWFLSDSDSGHAATRNSNGDSVTSLSFTTSDATRTQNETFIWGPKCTHATEESNFFKKYCESNRKEAKDFAVFSSGLQFERGNQEPKSKVSMHEGRGGTSNVPYIDTSDWSSFDVDYHNGTDDSISHAACDGEHDADQVHTFINTITSEDDGQCLTSFASGAVSEKPLSNCSSRELPKGHGTFQNISVNNEKWDVMSLPFHANVANLGRQDEIGHSRMPISSLHLSVVNRDVSVKDVQHTDVINSLNCKLNGELVSSSVQPFMSNGSSSLCDDLTSLSMSSLPECQSHTSKNRIMEMDDVQLTMSHRYGKYHHFVNDKEENFYQDARTSCSGSQDEDEADVCYIEETSNLRRHASLVAHGKSGGPSVGHSLNSSIPQKGCLVIRSKADDESLTFRVALQDLSQTNSEANPPDGVLAVPLLRHQRIALSWMVQKETTSINCSGGILADDQGLGKTVSTIALILMERAPLSTTNSKAVQQPREFETFNLDDDDDDDDIGVVPVPASDILNEVAPDSGLILNQSSGTDMVSKAKPPIASASQKGRPAAGTLIVCPTSVLRQWAEELHNKVTSKANLSVLVYYGSNRTKDPEELAKYDVVLTTYSIVTMEVPKQPFVDRDGEERGGKLLADAQHISIGLETSRKRKYPPVSSNKKSRKGNDSKALESVSARPLARVGWYRVVLDEAQSIKNHRTQVARACWGLRAKRRWCLSGTPIQNAVDDLYSYFRFLRYEPYAIYKSFCSMIKIPINRNPTSGYKKLQAVLRTIMLRRTKASLLDGKPIVNLPPKIVLLKRVDFSEEERSFYSRLEADSRAQFKEYADAGTVKENYVNILLMLLRLRQACDHPLLVNGYDSSSIWRASAETAKKLPKEKQVHLLSCLETSYAICGLCNDPPEDAVVAICGHVFCNQCICEHITGDDSLCPAASCNEHVSVTSVFSRAALQKFLSDQFGQDCFHHTSPGDIDIRRSDSCGETSVSSKMKAALEIIQSLSKSASTARKQDYDEAASGLESASSLLLNNESGQSTPAVEKAIVFSQWTRMLDLLETPLRNSSIQYRRLDGTMSVVARHEALKDFNTLPEVSVMIMSLKAASLGLNMVTACHVLMLDLWWNPTTEDQAIDRAHRIGQTRPVKVSRLTVKDTIEDRILALQEKKREMVASAFGEDETGGRQTRLTVEDLRYLFSV